MTPDAADCPHFQPADLVALAEKHLHETGVPESAWEGRRFYWGGPIDSPPFTGLILECKRKHGDWAIVRLDRRKQGVTAEETGFREIGNQKSEI